MMGMMPNKSTSTGSMWTPQGKGNTAKLWRDGTPRSGNSGKSTGGFLNRNPGINEQRNSKKSAGCAFCG
jgi:hypothetical protein